MKSLMYYLILLVGLVLPSNGSFFRDVVGKKKPSPSEQRLNDILLEKAIPLSIYEKSLNSKGFYLRSGGYRQLEDGGDDAVVYENEDDYYVHENNYVNYTGYSFKYAKCQPVQRFSQKAVEAGEYSPMVVNDIVILRLCPSVYCSDSRAYGCNTDYVEYAIELTDYIRVMLRYEMDRKEQLCDWCDACGGNRRRVAQKYYYTYDESGNIVQNEDYVPENANLDCTDYESYCFDSNGNYECENEDNGDDDGYSMNLEGYLNIIDCTQVNGGYFLRPRYVDYHHKHRTNHKAVPFYPFHIST